MLAIIGQHDIYINQTILDEVVMPWSLSRLPFEVRGHLPGMDQMATPDR